MAGAGHSTSRLCWWLWAPVPLLVVVGVFSGSCSSLVGEEEATHPSPLLEAVFLAFIEQVCLRAPQIDNLWATISVLLLDRTLFTVVGVGDSGTSTDHTPALVRAIVTLITYSNQGAGTHVGITDNAFAITCKERRTAL